MAFSGSTTLKYMTAFTRTETLSLVITSCVGTSIVTVLRLTLIIFCTPGIRSIRPGPFVTWNLPRKNITPLSYSGSIFIALQRNISIRNTTIIVPVPIPKFIIPPNSSFFSDLQLKAPNLGHRHAVARLKGLVAVSVPVLALDKDLALVPPEVFGRRPLRPHEPFGAAYGFFPEYPQAVVHRTEHNGGHEEYRREH